MTLSSLSWKFNRLRAMGFAEVIHRARQLVQTATEKHLGWGLVQDTAAVGSSGKPWNTDLPTQVPHESYMRAADAVLSGRFRVFALTDAHLGFPPEWNRDPKTGTKVGLMFGKSIDYRREQKVGDIKYLWEINRHLELVTLAQAWNLTREERFAFGCRAMLESWFDACPYPMGVNWTSSLEHGIRLVNWAFSWHLLGGESSPLFRDEGGEAFRDRWLRSVRQHLHFIAGHHSRHSSANNHLLGELMGLLIGTVTWPLWPECPAWREKAHTEFEAQALLQTSTDGVNREQAIYYQHEVMDMMLVCGLLGRRNDLEFSADYWDRLERMAEFLRSLMDRGNNVPMIGDADDARIVRLDPGSDADPYSSLLTTCALLFRRPDFKVTQTCDDKTLWLLGARSKEIFDSLPVSNAEPGNSFAEGGYYLLTARRGQPDEILACVDCGPLGYPAIAAHGHADALSLTISAGGIPLLIDPGTFAYHTQKKWRDYFRSTFAHNTATVDGLDQSVSGGNFLWTRKANARALAFEVEGHRQRFEGMHDGYTRLPDSVVHRRTIELDTVRNEFTIEDLFECRGSHVVEICWHFPEYCSVNASDTGARVSAKDGPSAMFVTDPPRPPEQIAQGHADRPAGWISYAYDIKLPTYTAVWRSEIRGSTRIVTTIRIEF